MLLDKLTTPLLSKVRFILASASPRRRQILEQALPQLAASMDVIPSTWPETLDPATFDAPAAYVQMNASEKARQVFEQERAALGTDARALLVLGVDTVVVANDRVLEKPTDEAAAVAMLSSLSGSSHLVLSGYSLLCTVPGADSEWTAQHVQSTRVTFADLSPELIAAYIATGEPFDKAGGYGIQSQAGPFVTELQGCYFNVMGLPLHAVSASLRECIECDLMQTWLG